MVTGPAPFGSSVRRPPSSPLASQLLAQHSGVKSKKGEDLKCNSKAASPSLYVDQKRLPSSSLSGIVARMS